MWRGSISALYDDKEHLESIGVVVGEYDYITLEFKNCIITDHELLKLDKF